AAGDHKQTRSGIRSSASPGAAQGRSSQVAMRPADIAPQRQISGQAATFRVEAFSDAYRCFKAAEEGGDALSQKAGKAIGVNVIFPGGVFELPTLIEQKFVVGVYFQ